MIDRARARHLALRFEGRPRSPSNDDGWCNLVDAFEQARSEYAAQRVMERLIAGEYTPAPHEVVSALKAHVSCLQCDDTGWEQMLNTKRTCPCMEYGLPPADCHNCGGKGSTLCDGVVRCHCRTAKAATRECPRRLMWKDRQEQQA